MTRKVMTWFSLPALFDLLIKEDNPETIQYYENVLAGMFASTLAFLAAIGIYFMRFVVEGAPLPHVVLEVVSYVCIGVLCELSSRIPFSVNVFDHLISILYSLTLFMTVFFYYEHIGSVIWTISFIVVVISIIRIKPYMLTYIGVSLFICGLYLAFFYTADGHEFEPAYFTMQNIAFSLVFFVAIIVFRINLLRHKKTVDRLSILTAQNGKIVALNSEISKMLAEKELILREVHHRIKNNMTSINGLLLLQASSMKDKTAINALENSANRIKSMQILYDKLYKSASFTDLTVEDYFSPLIVEIKSGFLNSSIVTIHKEIETFKLTANQLQTLGIIINELLSNIMKHAFNGRESGNVWISVTLQGNVVSLIFKDDGIGLPENVSFEDSTGFGLVLVHGLTQILDGSIRIERENGTRIILEFAKGNV